MANSARILKNYIVRHEQALSQLESACGADFAALADSAVKTLNAGKKILLCGNGGSAAEAQHIAAELSVRFAANRRALPALALSADMPSLTACGNDFGFSKIFARQIEALGAEGDLVIGYSTSGKSENILLALQQAKRQGLATAGLTGVNGDAMRAHCNILIKAPSDVTAHIQEIHTMLGHALCVAIEDALQLIPYGNSPWKD